MVKLHCGGLSPLPFPLLPPLILALSGRGREREREAERGREDIKETCVPRCLPSSKLTTFWHAATFVIDKQGAKEALATAVYNYNYNFCKARFQNLGVQVASS